jgi:hypothetical protein
MAWHTEFLAAKSLVLHWSTDDFMGADPGINQHQSLSCHNTWTKEFHFQLMNGITVNIFVKPLDLINRHDEAPFVQPQRYFTNQPATVTRRFRSPSFIFAKFHL